MAGYIIKRLVGIIPTLIPTFSNIFPSLIGGSIIIETLFSIPGMGNQTVQAIIANDYPIVIAILTLTSIITLISY